MNPDTAYHEHVRKVFGLINYVGWWRQLDALADIAQTISCSFISNDDSFYGFYVNSNKNPYLHECVCMYIDMLQLRLSARKSYFTQPFYLLTWSCHLNKMTVTQNLTTVSTLRQSKMFHFPVFTIFQFSPFCFNVETRACLQ